MDQPIVVIPFALRDYSQLVTHYDQERKAVWHYLNSQPRPCFTTKVLSEIHDVQDRVRTYRSRSPEAADEIRYLILASAIPSVYSLGGDLDLFSRFITEQNHEGLRAYAYLCIDCAIGNALHLRQAGLTTISLVQGKALGGGFEAALSCNVLVAERGTQFGFPEILFNLFPGMGAYSFLIRRIDPVRAENFLRQGDQYSAETLYEMGVVDVLAEKGEGIPAVHDYIRRHERNRNGLLAIQRLRGWNNPITREELIRVADLWVETAMKITERDLRTMRRLTSAQHRLVSSSAAANLARTVAVPTPPSLVAGAPEIHVASLAS